MSDFFRVQLGVVSRSEGHSAAKRSAYQSCGKIVDHEGRMFDFARKAPEHVKTIMLIPQSAPVWASTPESLWQRAAAAEKRVDAQEARIVDFSMPRSVPARLWESCVRYVYRPFIDMGMVMQVDIHDSPASDGGRNVNVHGLATLRGFNGGGFTTKKNRAWNEFFRERNGRVIREQFAERLATFCRQHGVLYNGDPRSNAERNWPAPEPNLPRWNFEVLARTGELPKALASLQDHRRLRRRWEAAQAEAIEAAFQLEKINRRLWERRERRQRHLVPARPTAAREDRPDRRAATLRAWHEAQDWIDADAVGAIKSTRFDTVRRCLWIDLNDGSTIIDRGDAIGLRGRLTWQAAIETAAAAERHGWTEVRVFGDQAYKDAVTVAAVLRGLRVVNHDLSQEARAELDRLLAEQAEREATFKSQESLEVASQYESFPRIGTSREIHLKLTQRSFVKGVPPATDPDTKVLARVLKPTSAAPLPDSAIRNSLARPSNPR
ncbi:MULTISPECIES: MobA/MobL family protein [unclassified Aminobacter]|uniref:MobA/MobL family protein n=1 Tax=unclassified Aminobacter TaxID=2644704 RepID=UPI000464F903|nr:MULTISPECIES: MobA/MobL family protein [unclassified Aminobacter]TWH23331.1 MobA/MobL family protein [Aminobacter sp. J15]